MKKLFNDGELRKDGGKDILEKHIFLYRFSKGVITEYEAEVKINVKFWLHMNMRNSLNNFRATIIKDGKRTTSYSVSNNEGEVCGNNLWLEKKDFNKAKELFILDRNKKIIGLEIKFEKDKKRFEKEIEIIKELKQ